MVEPSSSCECQIEWIGHVTCIFVACQSGQCIQLVNDDYLGIVGWLFSLGRKNYEVVELYNLYFSHIDTVTLSLLWL